MLNNLAIRWTEKANVIMSVFLVRGGMQNPNLKSVSVQYSCEHNQWLHVTITANQRALPVLNWHFD